MSIYATDTPSYPNFASAEVRPDKPIHEVTEYRFSTLTWARRAKSR